MPVLERSCNFLRMYVPKSSPGAFGIRYLELTNLRGLESVKLDFGETPRPMTVIIGRNGTGKTTLLRAIAIALADHSARQALLGPRFGRWIQLDREQAQIRLWLASQSGSLDVTIRQHPVSFAEFDSDLLSEQPPAFLCAYGVNRSQTGAEPSAEYRLVDAVAGLFQYGTQMAPSELVLRRLRDFLGQQRFQKIFRSLKQALGLDERHEIRLPPGGGIEVEGPGIGGAIPLDAWADGYRLTFLWLIDLFGWAMQANAFDDEGDVNGIVLVDEIEQHLHPTLQRELLGYLRAALPKVQWIVTTHSPIVALAAGQESLVALHRRDGKVVSVVVPSLAGYSAEDVLAEEALFGTDPEAPEAREKLDRLHELQRKHPALRSVRETAELKELGAEFAPTNLPHLRDDPTLAKLAEIEALLRAGKNGK